MKLFIRLLPFALVYGLVVFLITLFLIPLCSAQTIKGPITVKGPVVVVHTNPSGTHWVELTWNAYTGEGGIGYNIYQSQTHCGSYVKKNASTITVLRYEDHDSVLSGHTYYYVATTLGQGNESPHSSEVNAVIP